MIADTYATIELEIAKCAKCGKCLSVCPVYAVTRDEVRSTRGRIALIEGLGSGELHFSERLRDSIQTCLRCRRCETVCPSDVRFDRALVAVRGDMPRRYGLGTWNRLVFGWLLFRRTLMDLAVRTAGRLQRFLPLRAGRTRHLPLFFRGGRRLPALSERTVLDEYGTDEQPVAGERAVYLFAGCMMNYAYAEMAEAMIRVLAHFGFRTYVPRSQVCCGTPVISLGDLRSARRLAAVNMRAFPGPWPIVTGCASCGETLKHHYPDLLGEKGKAFSRRLYDFAEFIDAFAALDTQRIRKRVVYHDPCHLKFGQGLSREPRRVLAQVSDYREMEGADLCCGMGGLFTVHHYELSTRIARRKTDAVRRAEADVVVSECPGCVLQLRDQLARDGLDIPVRHTAQVIEEALGLGR